MSGVLAQVQTLGSPADPARPISGASERVLIEVSRPAVISPEAFIMTPV
jgi:hypothetical protein